jgi:hypothetical protein
MSGGSDRGAGTGSSRRRLRAAVLAALVAVVVLLIIGRRQAAPAGSAGALGPGFGRGPGPASAQPAGGASAAGATLRVVSVTLGKAIGPDKRVTAAATIFGKDDTIFAVVATEGTASNANLTASWSAMGGLRGKRTISADTLVVSPPGAARTVFQILARKDGWAAGDYQVEILLDARPVAAQSFRVVR